MMMYETPSAPKYAPDTLLARSLSVRMGVPKKLGMTAGTEAHDPHEHEREDEDRPVGLEGFPRLGQNLPNLPRLRGARLLSAGVLRRGACGPRGVRVVVHWARELLEEGAFGSSANESEAIRSVGRWDGYG